MQQKKIRAKVKEYWYSEKFKNLEK